MQENSWENNVFNSQDYSLIIRGHNLNFEEFKKEFGFDERTKIIREGDTISKFMGKSEKDVYSYTEEYEDGDEGLKMLLKFLEKLRKKKELLKAYSSIYDDVVIRIFLHSSQAQMLFFITQDILKALHELDLPIELSVFSWGEVLDN